MGGGPPPPAPTRGPAPSCARPPPPHPLLALQRAPLARGAPTRQPRARSAPPARSRHRARVRAGSFAAWPRPPRARCAQLARGATRALGRAPCARAPSPSGTCRVQSGNLNTCLIAPGTCDVASSFVTTDRSTMGTFCGATSPDACCCAAGVYTCEAAYRVCCRWSRPSMSSLGGHRRARGCSRAVRRRARRAPSRRRPSSMCDGRGRRVGAGRGSGGGGGGGGRRGGGGAPPP